MSKTHRKQAAIMAVIAAVIGIGVSGASMGTDRGIEAAFKDSAVYRTYLSGEKDDVKVKADEGVVTLSGRVSNTADRTLAETMAANINGVQRVENELVIASEPVETNADGWLATKVKTSLMFHKNVSGLKTDVAVKEGVVTLSGTAENQAQRDLATQWAQDVDGVKSVINKMNVAKPSKSDQRSVSAKVDDASITAQVKTALLFHRSTSALRTDVKTSAGIVTLSGKAKNPAEKDLVTKVVSDIDGVQDVINNMVIDVDTKG